MRGNYTIGKVTDLLSHDDTNYYPGIAARFEKLPTRPLSSHSAIRYLDALLSAEVEERERHGVERRLHAARLPRLKTLEKLDFRQCPRLSANQIRELAEGGYLARAKPVVFVGDCGTGKTHLTSGLVWPPTSRRNGCVSPRLQGGPIQLAKAPPDESDIR